MTRLILHIGAAKTGTTAIQAFLSFNRAALEKGGVWYPDPRKFSRGGDEMGHRARNRVSGVVAGDAYRD